METTKSPLAVGLSAALANRRLAGALWAAMTATAVVAWLPLRTVSSALDQSPFRETVLRGWDSWAFLSGIAVKGPELASFGAALAFAVLVSLAVDLFLSMGTIRVLRAGVRRPVLRRLVADGASLFRPALWGFLRYVVGLVLWTGLLAAVPALLLSKLAGRDAPPNGPLATAAFWWAVVAGTVVFLNASARFALARIALARDDAPSARGAFRVSRQRLRGHRASAAGIVLFWLAAGLLVQALFTNLGVGLDPSTNGGVLGLVVLRQLGFVLLAATRVGFWGSFLSWEEGRRPKAAWALPHPAFASASPAATPAPATPAPVTPADGPAGAAAPLDGAGGPSREA